MTRALGVVHCIGHFQGSDERHRSTSVVRHRRSSSPQLLPVHLRTLGWIDGNPASHSRVIGPRRVRIRLLSGAGGVRSVKIRRGIPGGRVLPHVHTPLRGISQLPDVIDRVVRSRIAQLRLLSHQLTFRHEPALRAAISLGHHLALNRVILGLEVVVVGSLVRVNHTNEVGSARLRRSTWVRSANSTSNYLLAGTSPHKQSSHFITWHQIISIEIK